MKTLISSSLFILIFVFLGNSQINLNDSLVGHFTLDGNTSDSSPVEIDGSNNNAVPTSGVGNMPNTAYEFNGVNSYIHCDTDNRSISDVVSVSAWFKTTMTGNGFIVTKYDFNTRGFHIGINNGTIRLGGRNALGVYSSLGPGQTIVNDGDWHHLYAEIDGNEWALYVDCKLESSLTTSNSNIGLASTEPLTIGNFNMGDQGDYKYFDGDIDEVRIYNRTLTIDEVNTLCNRETYTNVYEEEMSALSNTFSSNIQLYPNPSNEFVNLKKSNDFKIGKTVIFAGNGERVLTIEGDIDQLDISSLNAGLYLVRFYGENNDLLAHQRLSKL